MNDLFMTLDQGSKGYYQVERDMEKYGLTRTLRGDKLPHNTFHKVDTSVMAADILVRNAMDYIGLVFLEAGVSGQVLVIACGPEGCHSETRHLPRVQTRNVPLEQV